MPVTPSTPGVYISESPTAGHPIVPAPTSTAAFVDQFERGPLDEPVRVSNFGEFTSTFGEIIPQSRASYGIRQFFENGGTTAFVVRVAPATASPPAAVTTTTPSLDLVAAGPGAWGNNLQAATQASSDPQAGPGTFDLVVREVRPATTGGSPATVRASEVYTSLTTDAGGPGYVADVLADRSALVRCDPSKPPAPFIGEPVGPTVGATSIVDSSNIGDPSSPLYHPFSGGVDDFGIAGRDLGVEASEAEAATGFYTLAGISPDVFNLLCLPAMSHLPVAEWTQVFTDAVDFCERQRAFFVIDHPTDAVDDADTAEQQAADITRWFSDHVSNTTDHAALYFPRIKIPDPVSAQGEPVVTENSGTIAGIVARTDAARGVWSAPAGQDASLSGVLEPVVTLNDDLNGQLNQLGINCIRTFPVLGTVVWGARTTRGADLLESPWKYVNVRRLTLFIEQSLQASLSWVVFEPNGAALWSAVRQSVSTFLDDLYRQGALQGNAAGEAYRVVCDATTTTPSDQQQDRVNVRVGFAPSYPSDFVTLTITLSVGSPPG